MSPQSEQKEAAEYLRLALPLMAKHDVSVTPRNYAVWYEYVAGVNDALRTRMNELMDEMKTIPAEQHDRLFREYIATEELALADYVREALRKLLAGASETVSSANTEFLHYEDILREADRNLVPDASLDDVRSAVGTLAAETKQAQAQGFRLVTRLADNQREIEALRSELEEAKRKARSDALTGLANRGSFDEALEELIAGHHRDSAGFGLIIFDIDKFKTINDIHGHLVGDKVIRFVAATITQSVKGKDIPARFGGEEFAVLLPETDIKGSGAVAESIRRSVERARLVKSGTRESLGVITLSAGIGVHQRGEAPSALLQRVDAALYRSKQEGRNRTSLAERPSDPALAASA